MKLTCDNFPYAVLQFIFGGPVVHLDSVSIKDHKKEVFHISGPYGNFFVKRLREVSEEEYCKRYQLLARAYDGDNVRMRPGEPRFFSGIIDGEEVVLVIHPWVEGEEIESPRHFQDCFNSHLPGLLLDLARGESILSEIIRREGDGPFRKKWAGRIFPGLFRCAGLIFKPTHGGWKNLTKELIFILPMLIFLIPAVPVLFLLELLSLLIKGKYCDQSNAEMFSSRPGMIYSFLYRVRYLLEVDLAGFYPYPGKNLAKIVGRMFFPSVPSIKMGEFGFCLDEVAHQALKILRESYSSQPPLRRLGVSAGFFVHLFVQLVESSRDNRSHIVPKKGIQKGKLYFSWVLRNAWALFFWLVCLIAIW